MIVACSVLGLSIHIAEWNSPRALVCSLQCELNADNQKIAIQQPMTAFKTNIVVVIKTLNSHINVVWPTDATNYLLGS